MTSAKTPDTTPPVAEDGPAAPTPSVRKHPSGVQVDPVLIDGDADDASSETRSDASPLEASIAERAEAALDEEAS